MRTVLMSSFHVLIVAAVAMLLYSAGRSQSSIAKGRIFRWSHGPKGTRSILLFVAILLVVVAVFQSLW